MHDASVCCVVGDGLWSVSIGVSVFRSGCEAAVSDDRSGMLLCVAGASSVVCCVTMGARSCSVVVLFCWLSSVWVGVAVVEEGCAGCLGSCGSGCVCS